MKYNIFDCENYKQYLEKWVQAQPRKGRGAKTKLAKAAGCQPAYVSQVINGDLNFSLEQAQAINSILGHGTDDGHYFLLLVQHCRAGSPALRRYYQEQLDQVQKSRFVLKERLGVAQHLSVHDQQVYYSSWIYAAIHVITDIPQFRTKEAISEKLGLPISKVADALDFLLRIGLVEADGPTFKMSLKSIHLGNDSALIAKHHSNWRIRAITALDRTSDEDMHYSSVITLSKKDVIEVKTMLLNTIKDLKAKVRESKEEELLCFSLDLFEP